MLRFEVAVVGSLDLAGLHQHLSSSAVYTLLEAYGPSVSHLVTWVRGKPTCPRHDSDGLSDAGVGFKDIRTETLASLRCRRLFDRNYQNRGSTYGGRSNTVRKLCMG